MSTHIGDPVVEERQYDVIIIGTGAGGGTLAHRLAPTGKRVLLLERGDYLPRERDSWDSTAVFVQGKYRAPEFWLDQHGDEFPPEVNSYVGGNDGSTVRFTAELVVSAGAVNSAALLLRSADDQHPDGLANSSGVVGPALHASQQPGADGGLEGTQPHPVPEDSRHE
jgi:choline dehydrogenase-like flavoprotein